MPGNVKVLAKKEQLDFGKTSYAIRQDDL